MHAADTHTCGSLLSSPALPGRLITALTPDLQMSYKNAARDTTARRFQCLSRLQMYVKGTSDTTVRPMFVSYECM